MGFIRPDTHWHLFAASADGTSETQLTDGEYDYLHAAWAPDSKKIVCVSNRFRKRQEGIGYDLLLIDVDKEIGKLRKLTEGYWLVSYPNPVRPVFTPDGKSVIAVVLNPEYVDDESEMGLSLIHIQMCIRDRYYYEVQRQNKEEVVCRLLDYYNPKRSLIFCNTKHMADVLCENLKGRGYFADALHGDLSQMMRDKVMNSFRNGTTEILIATDVAARGLDVDDVEAVFNFDIPQDVERCV